MAGSAKMTETFSADIPAIFSFTLDVVSFPEALHTHAEFINSRLRFFNRVETGTIKPTPAILTRINGELAAKFLELEALLPESTILIWHLNFMKSYLDFRFAAPPDLTALTAFSETDPGTDPALNWYKSVAYFLLADRINNYTNATLAEIVSCTPHLPKTHQQGLLAKLLNKDDRTRLSRLGSCKEHLNTEPFLSLQPLFPHLSITAIIQQARHTYTRRKLLSMPHYEFFTVIETDFAKSLEPGAPRTITLPITASAADAAFPPYVPSTISLNPHELSRFVAHLINIGSPVLSFDFGGLPPEESQRLNLHLVQGLIKGGFLNSEGMLFPKKIFSTSASGDQTAHPDFLAHFKSLLESFQPKADADSAPAPLELPGKLIDVAGDGNCLFRAVAVQLFGDETRHAELRANAVAHLREHPELLAAHPPEGEMPDVYLERMEKADTWAEGPIIEALALHYNLHLSITDIRRSATGEYELHPLHINEGEAHQTVGLVRHAGHAGLEHYLSLDLTDEATLIHPDDLIATKSGKPAASYLKGIDALMKSDLPIQLVNGFASVEEKRNLLSRFSLLNALFLFRKVLGAIPHPPTVAGMTFADAKWERLEALINACLTHAALTKSKIKKVKTFVPAAHAEVFAEAGSIVDALWASPHNLVLQTGTPIMDAKKKSEHAFYIALQFEGEAADARVRIVIFNGGSGLNFHRPDASLAASEFTQKSFGQYHAVASKKMPLDAATKTFLQNYLYKILTLPYQFCAGDKKLYKTALRNIYLGKKETESFTFSGYGTYTKTDSFREAVDIIYRAQLHGNCTIYNLKKALAFAAGLTDLEFGVFEDSLLFGMQSLLSLSLSAASSASAGSGAPLSGAGEPGAAGVEGGLTGLEDFSDSDEEAEAAAYATAMPLSGHAPAAASPDKDPSLDA